MYILGYSGLHGIVEFRAKNLGKLSEFEKRITQGMDSAAVLIKDGQILAAAEEERFINEKHTNKFPVFAIRYCLEQAGISIDQVDQICHGFNFGDCQPLYSGDEFNQQLYNEILSPEAQIKTLQSFFPECSASAVFSPIDHHCAHAASAFYPSNFNSALVIVADGMGEVDSVSVFSGDDNGLKKLNSYDLLSSIGMLYSIVTLYLGFTPNNDEYKVMGLAPYGDPKRYQAEFENLILLESEGEIVIPSLIDNATVFDKQTYQGLRKKLAELFGPARSQVEGLTKDHQDIAAALQQRTNEAMMHVVSYWQKLTGKKRLCLAGGVAFNCVANGEIASAQIFDNIYIQPAAGDAGTALGAALYYENLQRGSNTFSITHGALPFYGPDSTNADIEKVAAEYASLIEVTQVNNEKLLEIVAQEIANDKVVAWMTGRMEFGPRALGHRSILANPMNKDMRAIVNSMVKKRESFRPFAPSVKHDQVEKYFETYEGVDYSTMLLTCKVREHYVEKLPAITHIDGTARIQSVNKKDHPLYWALLDRFELITGMPILLNTSFNVRGQAIVCYADDAIKTFLSTHIDLLVINNYMIQRKLSL